MVLFRGSSSNSQKRVKLREQREIAAHDRIDSQIEMRQEKPTGRDPSAELRFPESSHGLERRLDELTVARVALIEKLAREHRVKALDDFVVTLQKAHVAELARRVGEEIHLRKERERIGKGDARVSAVRATRDVRLEAQAVLRRDGVEARDADRRPARSQELEI